MRSSLLLALLLASCTSTTPHKPVAPPACAAEVAAGESALAQGLGRAPTDCERAAARVDALGCTSWAGPGPDERPGTIDDESGAQVCAVVELSGMRGVTMAPACVAVACACAAVEACAQGGQ